MRILGIEFGAWSLKAVEMESRFGRVDILDFHEIRLPLRSSIRWLFTATPSSSS